MWSWHVGSWVFYVSGFSHWELDFWMDPLKRLLASNMCMCVFEDEFLDSFAKMSTHFWVLKLFWNYNAIAIKQLYSGVWANPWKNMKTPFKPTKDLCRTIVYFSLPETISGYSPRKKEAMQCNILVFCYIYTDNFCKNFHIKLLYC